MLDQLIISGLVKSIYLQLNIQMGRIISELMRATSVKAMGLIFFTDEGNAEISINDPVVMSRAPTVLTVITDYAMGVAY